VNMLWFMKIIQCLYLNSFISVTLLEELCFHRQQSLASYVICLGIVAVVATSSSPSYPPPFAAHKLCSCCWVWQLAIEPASEEAAALWDVAEASPEGNLTGCRQTQVPGASLKALKLQTSKSAREKLY
jgi:hypothetical protein